MKKLLSFLVIALLTLSVMPIVLADGDDVDGGIDIDVDDPYNDPVIYTDPTQRSFYPNDQTYYTAELYNEASGDNLFGDPFYDVSIRGNYLFTGETVTYYVIVEDADGEEDIDSVILQKDGIGVGSCAERTVPTAGQVQAYTGGAYATWAAYAVAHFGISAWVDADMDLYSCTLIVQDGWQDDPSEINIEVTDENPGVSVETVWSDFLIMNPPLSLTLSGSIDFGSVEPGETVTSTSVQLNNVGSNGVVMDMYIASDDYFTDPDNYDAICGIANGINMINLLITQQKAL